MIERLKEELEIIGFSKNTIKTYIFYNRKFLDFIKKRLKEITIDDLRKYFAFLNRKKSLL